MIKLNKKFHSIWKNIPNEKEYQMFPYQKVFKKDKNLKKINLYQGELFTNENYMLPTVKRAIKQYINNEFSVNYLPLTGDPEFINPMQNLFFRQSSQQLQNQDILSIQCLGSTGAQFVIYYFLKFTLKNQSNKIYYPNKHSMHNRILAQNLGFDPQVYPYFNEDDRLCDFQSTFQFFQNLPEQSIVFLSPINQNPTHTTFDDNQWIQIADLCKEKKFIVIMDLPNFGIFSGKFQNDSKVCMDFYNKGIQMFVGLGLSSTFSMQGHRLGLLTICNLNQNKEDIKAFLGHITRNTYNFYPRFGSDIAKIILRDEEQIKQLQTDIQRQVDIYKNKRRMLQKHLEKNDEQYWKFAREQKGQFFYTAFNSNQVEELRNKYSIHIIDCAKFNLGGINNSNAEHIAECLNNIKQLIIKQLFSSKILSNSKHTRNHRWM